MAAKTSLNKFIEDAKMVHSDKYDYSKVVLVNMTTKVEIVCNKHGSFWQVPRDHVNAKAGCRKCSAEASSKRETMSFEQFLEKAKAKHGDKYSYDESTYVEARKKIKINCSLHGEFWQQCTIHYNGAECPKCAISKSATPFDDFIKKAKEYHNDKYDYSKVNYVNMVSKIEIICPEHGSFYVRPSSHLKYDCRLCSNKKLSEKQAITFEKFVEMAVKKHGNKYIYDENTYVNLKTKTKMMCPDHGEIIFAPRILLNSTFACKQCHKAKKFKKLLLDARQRHGDKYDYSNVKFEDPNIKVEIICKKHGSFKQNLLEHSRGRGCKKCASIKNNLKNKKTIEHFLEKSKFKHGDLYDYSKVNYENTKIPVEIICKKHGSFFQSPNDHMHGYGCKLCSTERVIKSKTFTFEKFVKLARDVHGNKYEYDKDSFVGMKSRTKLFCNIHGWSTVYPISHICKELNRGCKECGTERRINKRKLSLGDIIERGNKIHNNKYDYSKVNYTNSHAKIEIICPDHGSFWQKASDHISNKAGCKECARIATGNFNRMTFDEFVKKSRECHGNKYIYHEETFKDAMSKTVITCPKHGDFQMSPNSHYFGQGCKNCTWIVSNMETRWLNSLGVPKENRNKRLPGLGRCDVDGYTIGEGGKITCYSFNGSFWHGDLRIYNKDDFNKVIKKTFGELYQKTLQKEALIREQGYDLIVMWEKDFVEMEKQKKKELKNNNLTTAKISKEHS